MIGHNMSQADWILRRLSDKGLRMTGQRRTVVQAIAEKPGAFSAEALSFELHPQGIGRATVYRTLELLEQQGMVTRMHLDGCHGFTLCDEGHHHHLVCSACNTVTPVDASDVEKEIQRLAQGLKFRVDTHMLEFAGLCETCQKKKAS
jgi:Fur family ferric uptake transcriptional regulator